MGTEAIAHNLHATYTWTILLTYPSHTENSLTVLSNY
jgi:hypothetical protein